MYTQVRVSLPMEAHATTLLLREWQREASIRFGTPKQARIGRRTGWDHARSAPGNTGLHGARTGQGRHDLVDERTDVYGLGATFTKS